METLQEINQKDISQVSKTITELISNSLQNPQFLNSLASFLEHSILVSNFSSPNSKLLVVNFLDKMNRHREKLEIEKGNLNISELKQAANRFGAKAQSVFETETD